MDVFISYSRLDEEVAARIVVALRDVGLHAWRDDAIRGGDEWRAVIVDALEQCRIVLLVYSAQSQNSAEVAKELAAASALHRPIVPLRIEDRRPRGALLYEMARLSWVDAIPPTAARLREVSLALLQLTRDSAAPLARSRFDQAVQARRWSVHPIRRLLAHPGGIAGALVLNTFALMTIYNYLTGFLGQQAEAGMPLVDSLSTLVQAATIGAPVLAFAGLARLPPPGGPLLSAVALTSLALGVMLFRVLLRRCWTHWRIMRARSRGASVA